MKFNKYVTSSGLVRWKFYHYLGIDPVTGKADEIEKRGFDTKSEARNALLKIIQDYGKKSVDKNKKSLYTNVIS